MQTPMNNTSAGVPTSPRNAIEAVGAPGNVIGIEGDRQVHPHHRNSRDRLEYAAQAGKR